MATFDAEKVPPADKVAKDVAVLRQTFRDGKTKPLANRRASLHAFLRMLTENESLLCEALWKDLHKNECEAMGGEIKLLHQELQTHLDHLDQWAAPQRVSTDLLNIPGSSAIVADPLGVCCVIGAWNYPILLTLMPVVGCLAAGNTCLIRVPSSRYSAESSKIMARLVRKYLDDKIVRVVEGVCEVTQAVLAQRYDLIFFTGGTYVGKMVARAAAEHLCPTVLELGGKSPCIVDASADVRVAAKRAAWGAFINAGQTCIRPDYVLVETTVADRFVAAVQTEIELMFGGGVSNPHFGRVINARAHERLVKLIKASSDYVVYGGRSEASERFIEPTLLDYGNDAKAFGSAPAMLDEIFGPIMPILRYESLDRVLDFVNDRPKPLVVYCFTTRRSVRQRIVSETTSGTTVVNDCMMHMTNDKLPYGGIGLSGMGSYQGKYSFDTFSHKKSVLYKTNWLDLPQRYPPYSPLDRKVLLTLLHPRPLWQIRLAKGLVWALALSLPLWLALRIGIALELN